MSAKPAALLAHLLTPGQDLEWDEIPAGEHRLLVLLHALRSVGVPASGWNLRAQMRPTDTKIRSSAIYRAVSPLWAITFQGSPRKYATAGHASLSEQKAQWVEFLASHRPRYEPQSPQWAFTHPDTLPLSEIWEDLTPAYQPLAQRLAARAQAWQLQQHARPASSPRRTARL